MAKPSERVGLAGSPVCSAGVARGPALPHRAAKHGYTNCRLVARKLENLGVETAPLIFKARLRELRDHPETGILQLPSGGERDRTI